MYGRIIRLIKNTLCKYKRGALKELLFGIKEDKPKGEKNERYFNETAT